MSGIALRDIVGSHPIARRLELSFDPAPLVDELSKLGPEWWHRHAGPYHDGGWESVSLWAPRGDPFEQRSFGGTFSATPALLMSPAFRGVLDQFHGARNRIRLMRLQPGTRILEHSDPLHEIDPDLVRLHVPVVTNEDVVFKVSGVRVQMRAGETWHVDVRFPHSVHNGGEKGRVHLVMDLTRNEELDRLLSGGVSMGTRRLTGYFAKHALPGPLRRALGVGN